MILSLLKLVGGYVLDYVFKAFGRNRDEQRGAEMEANKAQAEVLEDVKKAKQIDNHIDGLNDADLDRVRRDLNERD